LIAAADRAAAEANVPAAEAMRRRKAAADLRGRVAQAQGEVVPYADDAWRALSSRDRALHSQAFTTNADDPDYRTLAALAYDNGEGSRTLQVPAGDVLSRFRRDVHSGELPAVSWLVAPENFSDHPSAPWYGAWYVSQVLDILTRNPAVWQKTVLILCYDENDGYFDHVPPFTAPHPERPETGRASAGIDTTVDWANVRGRDHSIGLGYRVPMVIASPWSRGGAVNSQVFDHTSVLRFLEEWLAGKGKTVRETNISQWRRTICGDLTSAFRTWEGEATLTPAALGRDATLEQIHAAKFLPRPETPPLAASDADVAAVMAAQEMGTRPSCPLPYDLQGNATVDNGTLVVTLAAGRSAFGAASQGAPFNGYSYGDAFASRAYAVAAGSDVSDRWTIAGAYQLRFDGPNGFVRAFADGPNPMPLAVRVTCRNGHVSAGNVTVALRNHGVRPVDVTVGTDSNPPWARMTLGAGRVHTVVVPTTASHGWYHFSVRAGDLTYRYAGRVETGAWSISDPAMGAGDRS
jgi:phospholipase C